MHGAAARAPPRYRSDQPDEGLRGPRMPSSSNPTPPPELEDLWSPMPPGVVRDGERVHLKLGQGDDHPGVAPARRSAAPPGGLDQQKIAGAGAGRHRSRRGRHSRHVGATKSTAGGARARRAARRATLRARAARRAPAPPRRPPPPPRRRRHRRRRTTPAARQLLRRRSRPTSRRVRDAAAHLRLSLPEATIHDPPPIPHRRIVLTVRSVSRLDTGVHGDAAAAVCGK